MNKDFHYYGTLTAALYAGFTPQEAVEIASAAQTVDEMTPKILSRYKDKLGYDSAFVPTLSGDSEFIISPSDQPKLDRLKLLWMAFHFIPGNSADHFKRLWGLNDKETQLHRNELNHLVYPDSVFARDLLLNLPDGDLVAFGVAMHAYCDTWAHFGHAARQDRIDDCKQKVDIDTNEAYRPGHYTWTSSSFNLTGLTKAGQSTPGYLVFGHGRVGHLPDLGAMRYRYRPVIANGDVVRDNPAQFLQCFQAMALRLSALRGNTPAQHQALSRRLQADEQSLLNDVLTRKTDKSIYLHTNVTVYDQSEFWKRYIARTFADVLNHARMTALPDYNRDAWLNANANWQTFSLAANRHLNRFLDLCRESHFDL